jgi:hypothetical protein
MVFAALAAAFLFQLIGARIANTQTLRPQTARLRSEVSPGRPLEEKQITVPIQILRGYLPVVEGHIGEQVGQNFLIDTGTSTSILNARVAKLLRLKTAATKLAVFSGDVASESTVLPSLGFGAIEVEALPVQVRDLSRVERDFGISIAAVVGMDVLKTASFRLDYEKKRMEFGDVKEEGVAVPFDGKGPLVIAEAGLEGRTLRLVVDTGSEGLVLFGGRLAGRLAAMQVVAHRSASSVSGNLGVDEVEAGALRIGGKKFHAEQTFYVQERGEKIGDIDGLLGIRTLGFKAMALDNENHVLYLRK